MDRETMIDQIVALATAGDEDPLLEMSVMSLNPDLYQRASEVFGGWDAALAAALVKACSAPPRAASRRSASASAEEVVERAPDRRADDPLYVLTEPGRLFMQPGRTVRLGARPEPFETPGEAGAARRFLHLGQPTGVVVFTDLGRYLCLDGRMVPRVASYRDIRDILPLKPDERVISVLGRDALRSGRIVHITRGAKGKASDADEFMYVLDKEPRDAFLLNEQDAPVDVLHAALGSMLFCASAQGRGILFKADELRSMGRRAVGVNVMKLDGDRDEIVGAFALAPGSAPDNVVMVTRAGLAKRVRFDEFRPQGRAGAGMQLAKLNAGDAVVAMAGCQADDDLVLVTDRGRVWRRPAHHVPLMGRPAKGDRLIELADDEYIVEAQALPCSSA